MRSCIPDGVFTWMELPSLTERQEDIAPLFLRSLSSNAAFHHRSVLSEQMQEFPEFQVKLPVLILHIPLRNTVLIIIASH